MNKLLLTFLSLSVSIGVFAQNQISFKQEEVIYGRKNGMALTLVAVMPENPNGKAIINLVSGGWWSSYTASQGEYMKSALPFITHGYTVFLVIPSSIPKFTIGDQLGDILRSIQFVRFNANKYKIDPENIGIRGLSSGGHLALLAATSNDIKDMTSKDSISRMSSKVQAVVAFCPPTDFLNFGETGINTNMLKGFLQTNGYWGAFNYTQWDTATSVYIPIEDLKERRRLDSLFSPTQIVSKGDPAVYIIHGDNDKTVPIQQSKIFVDRYQKEGLEIVFVIKEGEDHDLVGFSQDDYTKMFLWLDKKLKLKE
jgi:acetyl esterase/lipase